MPLSTDIYSGVGQRSMGGDLANALNQFSEQRARLADLAQQRQQQEITQGFQNRAMQRAEEAYPSQQAALQVTQEAAKRKALEQVGRDIDLGIYTRLQSGIPREEVAKWAQQEGLYKGLSHEQIQAGIAPMSQIQEPDKLTSYYQRSAMPQEVMKAEIEAQFRKPTAPTALANIYDERSKIAAINPNDPRLAMYDQLIQKTVTTPPATQIVTTEGGGMQAITLPKIPGQKATVQSLGIQAVPKVSAQTKGVVPKQDVIKDATESNALLDQVERTGALATGSGFGAARDIAAGLVGVSTEGAKAAAKLKVLGASLTAKVPKMSGPQSDKDVAMYKEAAGNIADPNTPWETKKAAIETIREINNRQLGYAQEQTQTPSGAKFLGFE